MDVFETRLVIDTESEPARLLGTYSHEVEDVVYYCGFDGGLSGAPYDCVLIHRVRVPLDAPKLSEENFRSLTEGKAPAVSVVALAPELEALLRETRPKPGHVGVRVDEQGREWYCSGWISLHE